MSYSGIEHKLRVFISSKCGGKYTIARKSLKKLLETTGLAEVYAFETEPASSEDTISSYLEHVDASNLCIFLVDNEDGVPPAVLSEEKRAKDRQLRLLYLFCDENKKDATPMQEEIKSSFSQKYCNVHEFSDIVSAAYDSVMQDIIAIYKRKEKLVVPESNESPVSDNRPINTDTYSPFGAVYSKYPYVCRELTKPIIPNNSAEKEPEESSLEKLLAEHVQTVLNLKQYDETVIDGICSEVIKQNSGDICEILKLRYQAQKNFYSANCNDCISLLQQAIAIAIESSSIPTWIANDIAIDIRHVQGRIDELNSQITIDNPGQKYIDGSGEPIFFPYLDRQVETMHERISNKYFEQLSISPYTISFGGLAQVFSPLAEAFCIAQLHGSIVQTEIMRDRLISIYSMLCTLYEEHDFIVEYVRLLVINRESKKLDTVIRTQSKSIDFINAQDVASILESINLMYDPVHKMMSKYLLTSRLGYYMNDDTYSAVYSELVEHAMNWVSDEKRIYNFGTFVFDFYKLNTYRVKGKDIVDFICAVHKHGLARFYMDCFKVLDKIDYSSIEADDQARIKEILAEITNNENAQLFDQFFSSALIRFCKNTALPYTDLEKAIEERYPDFYKHTFLLEITARQGKDMAEFIETYLDDARSRNRTQGQNGVYSGYAYECLDVVYNIVKGEPYSQTTELQKHIIDVCIETLSAKNQTIRSKRSAIKLLQYLYLHGNNNDESWLAVRKQCIDCADVFSTGNDPDLFSKETDQTLSFQYSLLANCIFDQKPDIVIEKLYSVETSDAYSIIQFLRIVCDFLEDAQGETLSDELTSAFLYFGILMLQHKERDVKYLAVRAIVELTGYNNTRKLSLIHLSQIMDTGTQTSKIAIISRAKQIKADDDSYLIQIINKGKSDSNYLVRYVAMREDCV